MNERLTVLDLGGLRLARLTILPGRALTLALFGLRKNHDGGHFHSEVILQFNQIKDVRVEGTLNIGSSLLREDAVKESGADDMGEGLHRYKVAFDSARIDVVAYDHVCSLLKNDTVPADEEKLLSDARRAQTLRMVSKRGGSRGHQRKSKNRRKT